MHIRPAADADRPAIATLHNASWQDAYRGIVPDDYLKNDAARDLAERWNAAEFQTDDVILVAEDDPGLVGFIAVWCRPDPFIDNLHTQPARRGEGIGRRLMAEAAQRLLTLGHTTAHLHVLASNTKALSFYQRLGGERTERREVQAFGASAEYINVVWTDLATLAGR